MESGDNPANLTNADYYQFKAGGLLIVFSIILVLLSGLVHSIWNLFTKKSINKHAFLWYCQFVAVLIYLPLSLFELTSTTSISLLGWTYVLVSMALHGVYIWLLAMTYTVGDLSQVYPIMRGISPLFVPLTGLLLLNEQLKVISWVGIIGIVIGILIAGDLRPGNASRLKNKSVLLAISVGVMITSYTVIDIVTLSYVPPILLNEATNLGNMIALTWIAFRTMGMKLEWRMNWKTILLGGVLAPGGYILFLIALNYMQVSQLAPMREIGTVIGTIFGIFILKEKQGTSRIFASIIITIGIILLAQ